MKRFFSKKNIIFAVCALMSGFLNGMFGSGGGTAAVPFMEEILHMDEKKSHATAIFIILGFTLVSLIFYGRNSYLDIKRAIPVACGGIAGAIAGAKLLSRLSGNAIRKIFGVLLTVAAFKMVIG